PSRMWTEGTGYGSTDFSLIDMYFENVHFRTRATFVGRLTYVSLLPLAYALTEISTLLSEHRKLMKTINVLIVSIPSIAKCVNIFLYKRFDSSSVVTRSLIN